MPTTNGNKKILDAKRPEFMAPSPTASVTGSMIASSRHFRQQQLYIPSNAAALIYNPSEDGWINIPSPALPVALGAGASAVAAAFSTGNTVGAVSLTATGGTTSTIVTNQPLARDLRGYKVHIIGGPLEPL